MQRRLYRSQKEKMIAGVCGGLAEYFDIDPVIIRIIFLAAALITGTGFIVYLVLWIAVPYNETVYAPAGAADTENGSTPAAEPEPVRVVRKSGRGTALGIILIVAGMFFLADEFIPRFEASHFWPVILIVAGAALLLKASKNN